ncbi:TetR/AcrR family transcriptional regulator [Eubacterium xylanophilum]|uniref:TetR/AcrR family transcriptional regulator n=1 Tax=Eubacterium xylanophilum TaxID=39497 RepID=UPI0004B8B495|nr:TetR/AcrR family transcriptional regulator [Eubacterium xylanophilum]
MSHNNNETLIRIQEAAMKEFMEKGFMKSSLRKICSQAGVTTGALYFFFKDKDDLFCSLVREPVEEIYQVMMEHFSMEEQATDQELYDIFTQTEAGEISKVSDQLVLEKIMSIMYSNREKFILLLTKGQGSSMENIMDKFMDASTVQYTKLNNRMQRLFPDIKVSPYMAHWMAHDQVNANIYAITHIESEEEARVFCANILKYFTGAWISIWKE